MRSESLLALVISVSYYQCEITELCLCFRFVAVCLPSPVDSGRLIPAVWLRGLAALFWLRVGVKGKQGWWAGPGADRGNRRLLIRKRPLNPATLVFSPCRVSLAATSHVCLPDCLAA